MQAVNTKKIALYLGPKRSGLDADIYDRLFQDRLRGIAYSESCKRALAVYYGFEKPPTPPPSAPVVALTQAVEQLTREVQSMRAELDVLRRQVAESHHASMLAADSAELRLALAASSVLAKPERAKVAQIASDYLTTMVGNGNGKNGG